MVETDPVPNSLLQEEIGHLLLLFIKVNKTQGIRNFYQNSRVVFGLADSN